MYRLHRDVCDVPRRYVTGFIFQCTMLRDFASVFSKIDTPFGVSIFP